MMRNLLLAFLLAWTAAAQANDLWDKLWLTPDQRGERLMQQGDAAAAAHTFHDPRYKAYAELKAGQYRQAAHDLAAFDNSDDLYNRGNALARAGQLQAAIKAYDAALHRDPHNRDAQHNRDLVKQALQKRQQQRKPAAGNSSSPGKNGDGKKSATSNHTQKENGSGPNQPAQKQAGENNAGPQHNRNNPGQQPAQLRSTAPAKNTHSLSKDDANQARRDAVAALDKLPTTPLDKTAPAESPVNEQQLSQQQWLRQIPDDPGGLLRRKFMIEHMIRQREKQP